MRRVTQNPATTVAALSQAVGPVSARTAILTMTAGAKWSCTGHEVNAVQAEQLVNQTVLAAVAHRVLRQDHLQDPRQTLLTSEKCIKLGPVGQLV